MVQTERRAMSIQGIGNQSPVQKIVNNPIQKSLPADAAQAPARGGDKVELSGVSHLLASLKAGNDFRADKVADIRAQTKAGKYADDDHKLDAAADKLLDELSN